MAGCLLSQFPIAFISAPMGRNARRTIRCLSARIKWLARGATVRQKSGKYVIHVSSAPKQYRSFVQVSHSIVGSSLHQKRPISDCVDLSCAGKNGYSAPVTHGHRDGKTERQKKPSLIILTNTHSKANSRLCDPVLTMCITITRTFQVHSRTCAIRRTGNFSIFRLRSVNQGNISLW